MKKKCIIEKCKGVVFLALAVFGGLKLFGYLITWMVADIFGGISFPIRNAATIGIIGGADGPTAVFVTAGTVSVWQIIFVVFLTLIGIFGFLQLKNHRKK